MRFPVLAILSLAIAGLCVPTLSAKEDLEIEVKDPELLPGDKAPAFTVEKFLKGDEFSEFEKGKVYIVECWATWCGPCLASIPHLTEIQEKHPEIKVVGISVSNPEIDEVEEFVTDQAEKMAYTVAWEGKGSRTKQPEFSKTWMTPAGAQGIPHAFIVDGKGVIAWMGHPMSMDEPLASILDGKWDVKKFREEHLASVRVEAEKSALNQRLSELAQADDYDTMLALLDKYIKEKPAEFKQMCTVGKIRVLSMKPAYAKQLVSFLTDFYKNAAKEDPETVFQISYTALGSNDPDEVTEATAKWPKELKAAIRKALEDEKVLAVHPFAKLAAAKAQFITGDKEKAAETLNELAEDPAIGRNKLQVKKMAKDFGPKDTSSKKAKAKQEDVEEEKEEE